MDFREQQEFLEKKLLDHRAKKASKSIRLYEEGSDSFRTSYQRDIGRILYSDVFRRLRLKTQVFMARDNDQHSRTRLTHTLEVSQIAKSIAKPLELNCDLVEAIALGHDLGHAPFGHAGEKALNDLLVARGKTFNHNVQSVWLVEQLLSKRTDINGKLYPGLNLTLDTLEGLWKHTKFENQLDEYPEGLKKLTPNSKGSMEAQIVNLADSISYCIHDIYDANNNGIITYDDFENDVWKKHFSEPFNRSNWYYKFIYDLIENNLESSEIEFSDQMKLAYKDVRDFIYGRIISSPTIKMYDSASIDMISEIYHYYDLNIDELVKKNKANEYKYDVYGKERVIVDYIQWFGDSTAITEYQKIMSK